MKRRVLTLMFVAVVILSFNAASVGFAKEKVLSEDRTVGIERVRWSGMSLDLLWKEWRIWGSWAKALEEVSLFGGTSPYFRLNGDDRTVFRGLGRESDFVQSILPTLQSRKELRDVMSANEMAAQSLTKFDAQVATGANIHMGGTALAVGGKLALYGGIFMMAMGLSEMSGTPEGEMPGIMKSGYNVAIAGTSLWLIGKVGQLTGNIVTKQAFAHLKDAMDYFNRGK